MLQTPALRPTRAFLLLWEQLRLFETAHALLCCLQAPHPIVNRRLSVGRSRYFSPYSHQRHGRRTPARGSRSLCIWGWPIASCRSSRTASPARSSSREKTSAFLAHVKSIASAGRMNPQWCGSLWMKTTRRYALVFMPSAIQRALNCESATIIEWPHGASLGKNDAWSPERIFYGGRRGRGEASGQ